MTSGTVPRRGYRVYGRNGKINRLAYLCSMGEWTGRPVRERFVFRVRGTGDLFEYQEVRADAREPRRASSCTRKCSPHSCSVAGFPRRRCPIVNTNSWQVTRRRSDRRFFARITLTGEGGIGTHLVLAALVADVLAHWNEEKQRWGTSLNAVGVIDR